MPPSLVLRIDFAVRSRQSLSCSRLLSHFTFNPIAYVIVSLIYDDVECDAEKARVTQASLIIRDSFPGTGRMWHRSPYVADTAWHNPVTAKGSKPLGFALM